MRFFENKLSRHLNDAGAAAVFEVIRNWIINNSKKNRNYIEGHFWTYNTLKQWHAQASFCSLKQLYKKICKLRDARLIYTKKFGSRNGNQTLWYRVDEEKYQKILNGTYKDEENYKISRPLKPPKLAKSKQFTEQFLDQKGKMGFDFPTVGNSKDNTINSNKKNKKEIKRRGWYLPPDYEDYNTWTPSEHIKGKIKNEFQLTDEQIADAYKEFVLYNNAMGIKIRSVVAMFTLWCKRFAKKLKMYVKKTYKKTNKVIQTRADNSKETILSFISLSKDKLQTKINTALLEYFGPQRYHNLGLMELKPVHDPETCTLDFVSIGMYLPDGIYRLRTLKSELLTVIQKICLEITKIKICGT